MPCATGTRRRGRSRGRPAGRARSAAGWGSACAMSRRCAGRRTRVNYAADGPTRIADMPQARGPKRIVVALDTGSLSRAAIETAARLAIGLRAELEALFVEDVNLRRLAALPFARGLGHPSPQHRRVGRGAPGRAR